MKLEIDRYFILNKPANMVSQFVSTHQVRLLGDLDFSFPIGTHAIGRLDNHSEGLLLLTTNKKVTRLLFQSTVPHKRTYLVQVQREVPEEVLEKLRTGVTFKIKGDQDYTTTPCEVSIVNDVTIYRKNLEKKTDYGPFTWLQIVLTEGKFHQVRKMVANVHHKCKRLIRIAIEDLTLGDLAPGNVRELSEEEFFIRLKLLNENG